MQDDNPESKELDIPPEQMMSDRGREEIGQKFQDQLEHTKRDIFPLDKNKIEVIAPDNSQLFAIFKVEDEWGTDFHRKYFSYDPQTGKFLEASSVSIEKAQDEYLRFTKVGRTIRVPFREIEEVGFDFWENTEPGEVRYIQTIFKGDQVLIHNSGQYKEAQRTGIEVGYSREKGVLDRIGAVTPARHFVPNDFNLIADLDSEEAFEDLITQASQEGGEEWLNNDGSTWARVPFDPSIGMFTMEAIGLEGEPIYEINFPQRIDTQAVIAEFNPKRFYENPTLPPEEDLKWKGLEFSTVVGVKITPLV
ncbi:MAG: hypothetical protein WD231_02700 [Candidatus Woykebacteria bacterium]